MSLIGTKLPFAALQDHGSCWRDCVAKLLAALRTRNYRIQMDGVFESTLRACAQSILLILVVKIVLQHIPWHTGNHLNLLSISADDTLRTSAAERVSRAGTPHLGDRTWWQ